MSLVENKKIHLIYEVTSKIEAGLELTGNEVKSIRSSQAQIDGAKVIIRGGEAYIVGMSVSPYQNQVPPTLKGGAKRTSSPLSFGKGPGDRTAFGKMSNDRTKRLLLKKSEILKLATESEKGLSLLPIKIYDHHGLLKLEVGIGKRKNKVDKRETIKLKEFKREKKNIF